MPVPAAMSYADKYMRRIPDLASIAPRYDDLTKPRDFTRPTCLATTNIRLVSAAKARGLDVGNYHGEQVSCQCYTQQISRMRTSHVFCMDVVQNGYFDDSRLQRTLAIPNGIASDVSSVAPSEGRRPWTAGRKYAPPSIWILIRRLG